MSDSIVHAIAGAGGGILSMALTYPLITLSTRSQVDSKTRISQFQALNQILKTEGTKGLYSYYLYNLGVLKVPCLGLLSHKRCITISMN
jgi:hypothetical protein